MYCAGGRPTFDSSVHAENNSRKPPGVVVFDNPNYPECCKTKMPGVCLYRIPVALHVPNTTTVMAFAEARMGASFGADGCNDGSGPGLAMRRSTDSGVTFAPI